MKKKTVTVLLTGVILGVMALTGCSEGSSGQEDMVSEKSKADAKGQTDVDQKKADEAAALIDAIYVQEWTDMTDKQCKKAKEAWDALTDSQKELVEGKNADPDYFGKDTGEG